ncbi:Protein SCAR2 [Hibiscus syriacus]|uniref:Protein SCAR n=1 Tax=Hibiscus syriacus TaxID=106335 RepID=A0A6A2WT03_HIBSY|nr:protein SCAR2-like [Hibiscus syriacus]XP_039050540.1 protein SCAR2-like [Hibiscus syriacus]KAE8658645.1 Protein SCAR2 [Hibiscus syriacus]
MPLTRYQIRNEFSLADPELYRSADKDDPEALLEGVAMSGLVGVLRQLGDLAEFAAEIFHDLHEEVMVTAARGHALVARVKQVEAEFPSIEKSFLSQTDHSLFFTSAGVDWHPNLRTEHNLITHGDLPRCVLDSYEECRGPPRLFLLDKFDVAGAGACLKRYSDPSFFKAESDFPEIAPLEVQRGKKARKVKKKGSRWKNGETPEFPQTSHAKLHQLFLEERIENAYNDPACLAKLKRRQLNESPLDSKSGKTYMEKFLETPSQNKAVYEISGTPSLGLTVDNSSVSGPKTLDISTVGPVEVSSQGKETLISSPTVHEIVLKPSIEELNEDAIDREIMKVPEPTVDFTDGIPHPLYKVKTEEEIIVDGESIEECNIYGDHSDGMTSEADNFIDAITTMESEMDMDNEYRPKDGIDLMDIGKYQTGSHANEEKLGVQAHSSNSQLDEISSLSDTTDNLAKDIPSDGEVAAEMFPLSRNCVTEIGEAPPIQLCLEMQYPNSDQVLLPKDTSFGEHCLPDLGEASHISCLEGLNSTHILLDEPCSVTIPLLEQHHEEVSSDGKTNSNFSEADGGEYLDDSLEVIFADSSEEQVTLITLSSESHPVDELGCGNTYVSSDALPHLLNVLPEAPEKGSDNDLLDGVVKTDFAGKICAENSVNQPNCVFSPTEKQRLCSTLAEGERCSGIILSPEHLDVVNPITLVSEVSDATVEVDVNLECITPVVDTSQICDFNEQQFSDILHHDPKVEADLTEIDASYSEQKQNVDELCDATEGEVTREFTRSGNVVEEDAIPCDLACNCTDDLNPKDHGDLDDLATENVHAENIALSTAACDSTEFDDDVDNTKYHSSNVIFSPSGKLMNSEESLAGDGDMFHEGLESNEVVSQECLIELETREETNQVVGTPADLDSTSCKSDSYNKSNLEDEVHYLSFAESTKDSLDLVDLTAVPASSEFSDNESELKYSSRLMESGEDTVPSPTHFQSENENSLVQSLDIHINQHVEKLHIVEGGSKQIQSLDHIDQEKCLQTSFEHSKEGSLNQSSLDFSEQSGRQDKQESYPSDLIHPATCLHPEATKAIMEEMPPLPPLPPMQWRIGRVQHVSTGPQREFVEHGQGSLPMIPQYGTGERAQFGLPALEQGFEQPRNPFLPLVDGEERSGNAPDQLAADFMHPSPLSMNSATMASNSNSQYNGFYFNRTHSNPFLTVATTSNENLEYGSLAMDGHRLESSYLLTMQPTDAACTHTPLSLHGETANCPDQFVVDTSLEGGAFQEPIQHFDPEHGNPPDVSVPLPTKTEEQITAKVAEDLPTKVEEQFPTKVDKQPQHGLAASGGEKAETPNAIVRHGLEAPEGETSQINTTLEHDLSISEGEAAWPSNTLALVQAAEEGKSNVNPPVKLPRPRNPLIDAVAAHDKSKLRKVTEQNRPPILSKIDERDSLLEQIRTKSFNLKPAVVTRARVQGPKTNIRVAAILEKANAIRQALTGSDEDDDEDGWSDS